MMWSYIVGPRFLVCVMSTKTEKNPKVELPFDPLRNTGHVGDCACVLSRGGVPKCPEMSHSGKRSFLDPEAVGCKPCEGMSANVRKCPRLQKDVC